MNLEKITYENSQGYQPRLYDNGGASIEEFIKDYKDIDFAVQAIGYCIYEDKESVLLCQTKVGEDFYKGGYRIAKRSIIHRVILEENT